MSTNNSSPLPEQTEVKFPNSLFPIFFINKMFILHQMSLGVNT